MIRGRMGRRIRTDLALETTERFAEENTEIRGVEVHEEYDEEKDVRTTVVKIVTENGAKSMGRPQGTYITIEAPELSNRMRIITGKFPRDIDSSAKTDRSGKRKVGPCGWAWEMQRSQQMHWDRM